MVAISTLKGREEFYRRRREKLRKIYWEENKEGNIYLPSGFREYPQEIYDLFLRLIPRSGKVLDLGCGNGLLLCHLVRHSPHKLIPYGVDFIEESIEQAKTLILPEYADNLAVGNIAEYPFADAPYDFILFDPYDLHSDDLEPVLKRALDALGHDGRIIFYTYEDVLKAHGYSWVGEFLPVRIRPKLVERIDSPEVSIGVYRKGSA